MADDSAIAQRLLDEALREHNAADAAVLTATAQAVARKKAANDRFARRLPVRFQLVVEHEVAAPWYRTTAFPLMLVLIGIVLTFVVLFGCARWPDTHKGCRQYSCNYAPIWHEGVCANKSDPSTCTYTWVAWIGKFSSWYIVAGWRDGGQVFYINTTAYPPYPNNTVCYRPPNCYGVPGPWIQDIDCIPIFTCTNTPRIHGRIWFICLTSIGGGGALVIAFVIWMCCDTTSDEHRPLVIA